MGFLRLLRHPVMFACLVGHAFLVLMGAAFLWVAELTRWSPLCLGSILLGMLILFLDLPGLWIASWFVSTPIVEGVFSPSGNLLWFVLAVLVLGSIQWGLIGMLFAVPDLVNKPEP